MKTKFKTILLAGLTILCLSLTSVAPANDLLLCQPQKGRSYLAVFYLPTAVGEVVQAKFFNGWEPPYSIDKPVQCHDFSASSKAAGVVAFCGVQYGPDGGISLVLYKPEKKGDFYKLTVTPEGPTGPGASETLTCQ